jgi:hypothetical protein
MTLQKFYASKISTVKKFFKKWFSGDRDNDRFDNPYIIF